MLELFPFSTVLSYNKSKPYYPVRDHTRFRRNHFVAFMCAHSKFSFESHHGQMAPAHFIVALTIFDKRKMHGILIMRKLCDDVGVLFVWVSIMENAIRFVRHMQCLELWLDKCNVIALYLWICSTMILLFIDIVLFIIHVKHILSGCGVSGGGMGLLPDK